MGCRKLSYYQDKGLAQNRFFKIVGSEKRETEHFFGIDYYPYGKILREFNPEAEKYLTTHHERDTETGLDYRGARYYDSDIARFLSLDPKQADFVSWSPYNYVLSNPVIFIDPSGRMAEAVGDGENSNKDVNTIGAPVVTNPDIISRGVIITTKTAEDAFGKSPTDPTFGFTPLGAGFGKVAFVAGFGGEGGGGAFIAVKPTQEEVALFINQIIPIQINPQNGLVSNNTLNSVTSTIINSINAFVGSLPVRGTPQSVDQAPINVSVLINTGGNQTVELANGKQIAQAIVAINNPNVDNVNIVRQDSGGAVFPDGSFGVFGTSPGQVLLKISSKRNVFGF